MFTKFRHFLAFHGQILIQNYLSERLEMSSTLDIDMATSHNNFGDVKGPN